MGPRASTSSPRTPALRRALALGLAVGLVLSSCSLLHKDDGDQVTSGAALGPVPVESGLPDEPTPRRGGQLVYGLEAESDGGWCLPEAQLAASGLEVLRALYDPLTVPDDKGGYAPYLAKSVSHDDAYKTWVITLRSGITFHDGSKLTAQVVKNNLDAYRGAYDKRSPLLFSFVFKNIATVTAVNELTVKVTTKVPWVAFPAALYSSGRVAIVAQAQLDADTDTCETEPIGTGPFSFVSWTKGESLKVKRNPKYWQVAPDKKPYPYLDAIDFRPIPNSDARLAALEQGELNMLHTSTPSDMAQNLTQLRDDGAINLLISEERTETNYLMINAKNPVLKDRAARLAVAQAIDKETLNKDANKGFASLADGPFAPEVLGHLDKTGFPTFDLTAAKKGVAALKAAGKSVKLRLLTSTSLASIRTASIEKQMLEAAGFEIALEVTDEADVINKAINGDFDLAAFRNQPGDDPDANYNWWYGKGNLVNFGRFDDPVINENLDVGRSTADPEKRRAAYEAINAQFAKEVWNVYLWYAPWAVAEASNVHGILGPDLPDQGGKAPGRIVTGHPLLGIWIDRT
ncbi:ABC transporter substrate-binding protein [Aquihabitans sp. G128]|uniref:ABC transporter substrate-binding protein n=1 Tax=Aquihabitans sp. G128 TaxID=2849779 RepID=UPI001C24C540|nr:ABC transporter substrate-binding protein [Aquihabitans sp. G128]QXC62085.1 ABC transporter substrate-binding protein [Aquihabitans sp. G128]